MVEEIEIYHLFTGEDESAGVPVEALSRVSTNTTRRLGDGHRAGYVGDGPFQTASEIKALSEFEMDWESMREGLSQVEEEEKQYSFTIQGESLEEYDIEVHEIDDQNRY